MGFLNGKSTLMIFDRHADLKYKYGSQHFWRKEYYVDTVDRNERVISEYIQKQMQKDYYADQISMREYIDLFTGIKNKYAKGNSRYIAAARDNDTLQLSAPVDGYSAIYPLKACANHRFADGFDFLRFCSGHSIYVIFF